MPRSGEASVWFNPTSHVPVQPFAYKKLYEKMFKRSPSSVGHVADEHDAVIEKDDHAVNQSQLKQKKRGLSLD
jgi:hypothetical protein